MLTTALLQRLEPLVEQWPTVQAVVAAERSSLPRMLPSILTGSEDSLPGGRGLLKDAVCAVIAQQGSLQCPKAP